MGKYIDWYIVELEAALKPKMRPDQVHDFVRQAEAHLTDSAAQLRSIGMEEKESELAAMQKFGRVRKIAEEAAGQNDSVRLAGRLGMAGSASAFVVAFLVMVFGARPMYGYGHPIAWLSACIATFCISAALARRIVWRPLALVAAIGCISLSWNFGVFFAQGTDTSRVGLSARIASLAQKAARGPAELARFDSEELRFRSAKSGPYTYPEGLVANQPLNPNDAFLEAATYKTTASLDLAGQSWRKAGDMREDLAASLKELSGRLTDLQTAEHTTVFQSALNHLPLAFGFAFVWFAFALGLNVAFSKLSLIASGRSAVHRRYA